MCESGIVCQNAWDCEDDLQHSGKNVKHLFRRRCTVSALYKTLPVISKQHYFPFDGTFIEAAKNVLNAKMTVLVNNMIFSISKHKSLSRRAAT